ncbi:MAG: SusC/RagA family TonB-linked outer membrane protein, partial [Parapedobacter sp.]
AALYGSRAGNGVVLITTKSGRGDQGLGITFSSSNVFEVPYRYVDFHYKYANGDRPDHYNEGSAYWGGLPLDQGNKAPHFMSPLDENGNKIPIELKSYPDNAKNFLETGITSVNNLTVAGSRGFGTYRVSYDMMRHNGMIPNSDLKRDAISSVAEFNVGQTIKLRTNLNFLRSSSPNRPATGRGANPLYALYNWSAVDVRDMREIWLPGQEQIAQRRPGTGEDNPYFLAYELTNAFTRDHAYGNVEAEWTPLQNLVLLGRVAHDVFNENQETKVPWSYSRASKGGYYLDDFVNQETNMEFRASYRLFPGDFDISLTAGTSGMHQQGKSQYMGGAELTIPGLYRISNIPTGNRQTTNNTYEKRIYSVFGLASIGFDDKLYLDVTARNDWSSTLPANDRSYFYPSASLSWLVNNTVKLPTAFSLFKLRGGVAQVGNDTGPYQLYNALGTGNWGDLITINIDQNLRNPILKPEIATSYEGGIDLNLFKNRLRFEGTYFYVENKNQILNVNVSPSSGYVTAKT